MTIQKLIQTRRTIHNYTHQKIAEADLLKALELGLWAPNHKHTHPWRYTLLGPQARETLAQQAIKMKCTDKSTETQKKAIRDKMLNPSFLVVLSMIKNSDPIIYKEDYAAMACAVQNISLYLWSKQIGTKWSSGALTRHEITYKLAQIDKNDEEVIGFLWVGNPQRIPEAPPRPQLEEVLRRTD